MKERFEKEKNASALADAYLFVGASRTRLKEVALDCAATLLDTHGSLKAHPDFALFDPADFGIPGLKVEHIALRKEGVACVERALRYRPQNGKYRAVVLFDADRMTFDAQSALLKTTEEPPSGTLLFFTAAELFDLSPALRSRCRIWRVPRLDAQNLARKAAAAGIQDEDWKILLRACGSGEAVLEMSLEERALLLQAFPQVALWYQGQAPVSGWCQTPAASRLAEKRHLGLLLLSATRAWLVSASPSPSLALLDFQAVWCRHLDQALSRLAGQVSPELVFQNLQQIP